MRVTIKRKQYRGQDGFTVMYRHPSFIYPQRIFVRNLTAAEDIRRAARDSLNFSWADGRLDNYITSVLNSYGAVP